MNHAVSYLTPSAVRAYSDLADEAKKSIDERLRFLEPVLSVAKGHCRLLQQLAQRDGISFATAHRWFSAARSGDLMALVDARKDKQLWKLGEERTLLPSADIALFQSYALRFQRNGGIAAAHRNMIRDLRDGKISTTQPWDDLCGHPVGWGLRNLRRHRPSDYELKSMRQGRVAASGDRPQVLTTRAGLRAGQYYVGDDVWHDHLVHFPGQRTPVRPVEASILDLASAALVQWGMRPRTTRADGTRENLTEREVRWVIAACLRRHGYRADELGTTWLVEKGTFALRDVIAKPLFDAFGIRVETSGIMSDKAWLGAYGSRGGGNPRFKTWLESIHNLRHNEFSALAGQVGMNRDHRPEEHAGLVRYAERVSDTEERLALIAPELSSKIARPVQTYVEFLDLCDRVYGYINERKDHKLEGWAESGHQVVQYLLGETLLDEKTFLALPPPPGMDMSRWGVSLAERGLTRLRVKSPAEVWAAGRKELTVLPSYGVSIILGADLGREQVVQAGELVWQDADLTHGELRYFAEITTPEGRRELLKNGEKYLVHANPFFLDELCVSDAKGRCLGIARRHDRASRADRDAMREQMGAVAAYEAQLQDALAKKAEPIMRERMATAQANIGVLETAMRTKETNAEARALQRENNALARKVQARAEAQDRNEENNDFLGTEQKPATGVSASVTGSATTAAEEISDYV